MNIRDSLYFVIYCDSLQSWTEIEDMACVTDSETENKSSLPMELHMKMFEDIELFISPPHTI